MTLDMNPLPMRCLAKWSGFEAYDKIEIHVLLIQSDFKMVYLS